MEKGLQVVLLAILVLKNGVIGVNDACFNFLREAEDVLDEDDYELLRDNNVYHHRPKVLSFVMFLVNNTAGQFLHCLYR